jgi:hypothetical protein
MTLSEFPPGLSFSHGTWTFTPGDPLTLEGVQAQRDAKNSAIKIGGWDCSGHR